MSFRYLDLGLRLSIGGAPGGETPFNGDATSAATTPAVTAAAAAGIALDATSAATTPAVTGAGTGTNLGVESGLTLQGSFAVGTTLIPCGIGAPPNSGEWTRNADAIFAVDFTGLNGDNGTGGRIFEGGGSGTGAYCGFRANGDFVFRVGSGQNLPHDFAAYLIIPDTDPDYPTGDGTLVVQVDLSTGTKAIVKAWWNNTLIDTFTSVGDVSQWCGSDSGGYLTTAVQGTQPAEEVTTGLTGYTTASAMRYYYNQLIP